MKSIIRPSAKKLAAGTLALMLTAGSICLPLQETLPFNSISINANAADTLTFNAKDVYVSGGTVSGSSVKMEQNDVKFKINVSKSGFYNIKVTCQGNGGNKENNFIVNGTSYGAFSAASTKGDATIKNVQLQAGDNNITIGKSWGYITLYSFELTESNFDPSNQYTTNNILSNANASDSTKRLYSYLCDSFGKKVISGQQESTWKGSPNYEMDYIKSVTGKTPAIRGLDFMNNDFTGVADRALEWWNKGGIVTICWHTGVDFASSYDNARYDTVDPQKLFDKNSAEYKKMIAGWDKAAAALQTLQENNVPVLWRPFHEFDGSPNNQWFWWGNMGSSDSEKAANFKKLWQMMYDYFTNEKGLNNLIWVLGYAGNVDNSYWYVGDEYCDIIGSDTYDPGVNKSAWSQLIEMGTQKPVSFHECGTIPTPDSLQNENALWSWFMTWHTDYITEPHNTANNLKAVYNSDLVVSLEDLPDLKTYGGENNDEPSVVLDKSAQSMEIGDTFQLKATTKNTTSPVTWSSSDTSVCSVSNTGEIKALKIGKSTITAAISGTNKTAKCTIEVKPYGITFDKEAEGMDSQGNMWLTCGETTQLPYITKSTEQQIWSSSDTSVCTVNNQGKAKALKNGTATITVTLKDSGLKASLPIKIEDRSSIKLDKTTNAIKKGESFELTATTKSSGGIEWSSSNTSVCKVDSNGKVTAVGKGSATITAKLKSNGKTATCTVTVTESADPADNSVISLDRTSASITKGGSLKLNASTNSKNGITWSSSKPSVCTVDQNGNVKALTAGTSVVTAKISNGKTAACTVTVKETKPAPKPTPKPTPKPVVISVAAPKMVNTTSTNNTVKVRWKAANGVNGYEITTYCDGKKVKTTDVKKATVTTVTGLKIAKNYLFGVKSYKVVNGKKVYSKEVALKASTLSPAPTLTAKAGKKSAVLTWNKIDNVTRYEVYMKVGTAYKKVGTTTKTSFTKNGLTSGKNYSFKVKAVKVANFSADKKYGMAKRTKVYISKPSAIKTVKVK